MRGEDEANGRNRDATGPLREDQPGGHPDYAAFATAPVPAMWRAALFHGPLRCNGALGGMAPFDTGPDRRREMTVQTLLASPTGDLI
ncbi:hypothetical protein [Telmatospirillum sp.]|uniref:hypothetical protein n=1 Tax=Telmatospirillum sp. TaxID=2079197 RepID=UPI0028425C79|nr:hypothetical protein [Telmatospirillum sp.]MDR3440118.1 hypothetical protein [Telmatospirillum sp.]